MKPIHALALLAALVVPATAQEKAEPKDDLVGFWTAIDDKGSVSVVSVHKEKDVYLICWLKEGKAVRGVMDRKGSVLAVAWVEGTAIGVSVYEVRGKTIHGPTEVWSKLKVGGDV